MKVLELRSTIEFFLIWMNQPLHQENLGTKVCKYILEDFWHHF